MDELLGDTRILNSDHSLLNRDEMMKMMMSRRMDNGGRVKMSNGKSATTKESVRRKFIFAARQQGMKEKKGRKDVEESSSG